MSEEIEDIKEIRASEKDWFKKLAEAYKNKINVIFIDDAGLNINPAIQTLLEMGQKAGIEPREWIAVLISVGVAGAGVYMIVAAILDPEPTIKLGLLIVGGSVSLVGRGFSAIRVLTKQKPPTIEVSQGGIKIKIKWD